MVQFSIKSANSHRFSKSGPSGIEFRPTKRFTIVGFKNEDFPEGTADRQWSELAFLGYKFVHDVLGVRFATVITCGEGEHIHAELARVASVSGEGLEHYPDVHFVRLKAHRKVKGRDGKADEVQTSPASVPRN
jgi:hypothetical protein